MKKAQENNRTRKPPSRKAKGVTAKTPSKSAKKAKPKSRRAASSPQENGHKSQNGDTNGQEDLSLAELFFPGGVETLLPIKSRKPLPEIPKRPGRKCLLEEIVQHAPEIYQRLISQIQTGVSFNVAAECAGINESTFYDWGYKGAADASKNPPVDSFFSRFYRDVRRAAATKAAECERGIAESSPVKWLTHGAGRIFGQQWSKDPNKRRIAGDGSSQRLIGSGEAQSPLSSSDDAIDAAFTVRRTDPGPEELSDGSEHEGSEQVPRHATQAGTTLALSPQQEFESLQVLESIGMLTISPQLREAYQQQLETDDLIKES